MADTYLNTQEISNASLTSFANSLTFTAGINREYASKFGQAGAKIGASYDVRKPLNYTVRSGRTMSVQDMTDRTVQMTIDTQLGVDVDFYSDDLVLKIDEFNDRYLQPQMLSLANDVDRRALLLAAQDSYFGVGTPGTANTTVTPYSLAHTVLDMHGCPPANDMRRSVILDPMSTHNLRTALTAQFNPQPDISDIYRTGNLGIYANAKFSQGQNVRSHTVGPLGGTPVVAGGSQTGSTLATSGWTVAAASRLKKGDTFTIAGVYSVNPITLQSTGRLMQFVVTADFSSAADGTGSISIYPPITPTTAYATVTGSPANLAAITVLGAANTVTPVSLVYHQDAMTMVYADLPFLHGQDSARSMLPDLGLSCRVTKGSSINDDLNLMRVDILFGLKSLRPEWMVRVHS